MQLHVHTSITSNTGKCQDVIATAIDVVRQAQVEYLVPIGLKTTSKPTTHDTRSWFSYMIIDSSIAKQIMRHSVPDKHTPHILLVVYDYISALAAFNEQTTGDCQIQVTWVVG